MFVIQSCQNLYMSGNTNTCNATINAHRYNRHIHVTTISHTKAHTKAHTNTQQKTNTNT